MGSEYSRKSLNFVNVIFTFQGFGLLVFDVYFGDFQISTLLVFAYSLLQLVNFKNLIHKIKKKYFRYKNREKINQRKSSGLFSSEADMASESSLNEKHLVSLPKFARFKDNLTKDKIYKLLNNLDTPFSKLNRFFVSDFDRLNPITKTQAIDEFNRLVSFSTKTSKLQAFTQNLIIDGMMSTVMNKQVTGNKRSVLGMGSFKDKGGKISSRDGFDSKGKSSKGELDSGSFVKVKDIKEIAFDFGVAKATPTGNKRIDLGGRNKDTLKPVNGNTNMTSLKQLKSDVEEINQPVPYNMLQVKSPNQGYNYSTKWPCRWWRPTKLWSSITAKTSIKWSSTWTGKEMCTKR